MNFVLIETQADSSSRMPLLLRSQPHPLITTSEQHKNNWKEKRKTRKKRRSCTLPLWGRLHKWHNCLESSAPGVNKVGTRCQSTGRSQRWWWQLVDCQAAWGVVGRLAPLSTNWCLQWEPSTRSTFYFIIHLVLHCFLHTSVCIIFYLSKCYETRLSFHFIKVFLPSAKETVGWIPESPPVSPSQFNKHRWNVTQIFLNYINHHLRRVVKLQHSCCGEDESLRQ